MIFGVRKWAVVVGIAAIGAALLGGAVGKWTPAPPPCVDGVAMLSSDRALVNCNPGEELTVSREGVAILVTCRCPSVVRHNGATR